MEKFTVYKLHFTGPLHLGDTHEDYGVSLKTIQSDTLYAALTSCLAKVGTTIPQNGDLGFTISSLFPFYQKDSKSEAVFFFPRPRKTMQSKIENDTNQNSKINAAKQIKKVLWLDAYYFQKIIQTNDNIFENTADIKGEFLTKTLIPDRFIESKIYPRVSVSRTGKEDATPFYMDKIFFKDSAGLFFLASGDTALLQKAMNILQYEGIGTDRNVGNGFFTYETSKLPIDLPAQSEYSMSLSIFIPENEEILENMIEDDKVAYDFIRRGGWITTPPYNTLRKKPIYAFNVGSVFKQKIQGHIVAGKIVDLNPETTEQIIHPIWRNGKSIFIPIKL